MEQLIEFISNHAFLSMTFLALLTWFVIGEMKRSGRGFNELTPMETTQLVNHSNAVLLDIREEKEKGDGTIVNSIHIPLGELESQVKKIEKHKEKPVVIYCRSGHRSSVACSKLKKLGFTSLYNLKGGVLAWQKDNLPLVKN